MESYRVSQRRACGLLEVPRSSFRYESQRDDSMLREKLIGLARERPRFGYRRLHILLQRGGVSINHKRVWRVYKAAGLSVKPNTPEEVDSQPATRVAVARGESGVGRRFCQRCDERRPNISGTERGGQLYPRMPGAGSRHEHGKSPTDSGAGWHQTAPRVASIHPVRQRAGTHLAPLSGLVDRAQSGLNSHPAWQASAERARRKFSWPTTR